jgi:hypothetical protein
MPVIDAKWPGLVDLTSAPHRITEIEEAMRFSALAEALIRIHQPTPTSEIYAFWTTKCDLWEPESWDGDEMDFPIESADGQPDQASNLSSYLSCYVDLLPRSGTVRFLFRAWQEAERCARALALCIRKQPLASSRIDIVVRSAVTASHQGFGLTAYIAARGVDHEQAEGTLAAALSLFTNALASTPREAFSENLEPVQ